MLTRTVSALMLTLILTSMLPLAFSIQPVKTELSPPTVPEEPAAMQGTINLASQEAPLAEWNQTYGGTNYDVAFALVQTLDGGYALAGTTSSFGAGNSDFWLVKTDAAGNTQWNQTYGGIYSEEVYALVQTSDGGYALAGTTSSFGAGNSDFWLVKIARETTGTIYIRADGSVNPSDAPILRDGDMYTVTDDINSSIVVEKNSIAIDGLGHLIQGNAESWQTAEGIGIDLTGRENVSVTNMIVMSFYTGISLHFSNGNSLSNITLGNNFYSMYIVGSSYNVINNNTVVSGNCGIYFFFDHDSFQVNFNNVLIGNYIFGCDSYGVRLVTCSSTFMRANTMSSSNCVFGVEGWDFEHYFNDIDSSNTVNGRPVYFWVNKSNRSVPTDAGYVALVNSTNVLVKDLNIHNVLQAVVLAYTDGSTVENVTASGCQEGIHLEVSQNNTISSNDISFSGYGIRFSERGGSSNNIVIGNRFSCDADGILLWGGTNNTLSDNSVINAYEFGISCFYADGNNVYHNTFISKGQAAYYYKPGANTWNNGYPSGGNYWSDYVGTDVFCGPSQNETGCDGVGDNPYVIDENNQDNYPLMGPWTKEGENITVTHASGICLVYADVTSNGITTVNETQQGPQVPLGFKLASEPPAYYDVRTTANYSGKITIAISYDDTNLTQEEENGLQLLHWNQTSQQWENITTYVNTQENVIYGETSHLSTFAIIAPLIHDVAVTRMIQSKTILCEGFTMRFNVTLANHGDFEEVFNVTVYANTAIIATFTNVTLASKNSTNLNISWNATGFARGNFTIWAYALPVPGETHTTDNDCTSGIVAVVMIGDIDADGKVDIKDVYKVALTYGTSLEGPNPPGRTYEPNCDINGDDKIDVKDYYIVCKHYGEFEP